MKSYKTQTLSLINDKNLKKVIIMDYLWVIKYILDYKLDKILNKVIILQENLDIIEN